MVSATSSETSLGTTPNSFIKESLAAKRVLVTGATGFIGSHLVERLANLGADVIAVGAGLGWRPVVRDLVRQGRVRFVNLRSFWNPDSLHRAAQEFDGIAYLVHLGYEMPRGRTTTAKAIDDSKRNVIGTLQLVQQLPASVIKICFASSVSVYGSGTLQPVSETDPPHPSTVYGIGKLATENYLDRFNSETGCSVSFLRYATVYGPLETDPRAIPNFIRQVLRGNPPIINGDGEDVRDYVHIQDVIQATVSALVSDDRGTQVYNIGSGKGYTTRKIAEYILRLAGGGKQPIFNRDEPASSGAVCNISLACSRLGYKPQVDIEEGLLDEINWFTRNPQFWRDP